MSDGRGVVADVPILVGLTSGGAASTLGRGLDVRVIDFMNHPAGAAVCSPLTAQVLRYQLPVVGGSGQGVGCGHDAGFRGV